MIRQFVISVLLHLLQIEFLVAKVISLMLLLLLLLSIMIISIISCDFVVWQVKLIFRYSTSSRTDIKEVHK